MGSERSTSPPQEAGADQVVRQCGLLKPGERALIIFDRRTSEVADLLFRKAKAITSSVEVVEVPAQKIHGQEPPSAVSEAMKSVDLVMGVTFLSMAHTQARIEAARVGARYLSLPEYSMDLLADEALTVDFTKGGELAKFVSDTFTNGREVHVTTPLGTDIRMNIEGRIGNCCPGYVDHPGALGSPPDIEANISPVETDSEGVVVVDGSIPAPDIGLLRNPVRLLVRGGRIIDIHGDRDVVAELERLFSESDPVKSRILGECGVGLNDRARLTGNMLTDEGAIGTMHFGFGSNATVGGQNAVSFHLDFVFRNPTLRVGSVDDFFMN